LVTDWALPQRRAIKFFLRLGDRTAHALARFPAKSLSMKNSSRPWGWRDVEKQNSIVPPRANRVSIDCYMISRIKRTERKYDCIHGSTQPYNWREVTQDCDTGKYKNSWHPHVEHWIATGSDCSPVVRLHQCCDGIDALGSIRYGKSLPLIIRWPTSCDGLGGDPFIQIGRHAIVNLRAIERVTHYVAVFTAYGCVTAEALKSPLRELVRPGLASVLKTHH
jgi:hypothetical protein